MFEKYIEKITSVLDLDQPAIKEICNRLDQKELKKGEFFLKEGQYSNLEGHVERGILRSFILDDGLEKIIEFHQKGDLISDYRSYMRSTAASFSIQAITDVTLTVLSKDAANELAKIIPGWEKLEGKFFEYLALKKQRQMESLIEHSAEKRYLYLLEHKAHLLQNIPQYYLAQYVGVRAESLSRIRKRLSQNKERP